MKEKGIDLEIMTVEDNSHPRGIVKNDYEYYKVSTSPS